MEHTFIYSYWNYIVRYLQTTAEQIAGPDLGGKSESFTVDIGPGDHIIQIVIDNMKRTLIGTRTLFKKQAYQK